MRFTRGNILQADCQAIVNTVNCVGVMGRGIAAQFKRAFPENFRAYEAACRRGDVVLGKVMVVELSSVANPRFVINFPTKDHWRSSSSLPDINAGLVSLVEAVVQRGISSIAIPALGCGLGGLDWKDVRPLIVRAFEAVAGVDVLVFEPTDLPDDLPVLATRQALPPPPWTPGRAALVGLMHQYLSALMDPHLSLLEVHKLMYFLQTSGENLRLTFKRAHFGPYAEELRHVLTALEGHRLSGYGSGGDKPHKPLHLAPGAADEARAFLAAHPQTQQHFDRVADLVSGFESSFGMELLATVHWLLVHDRVSEDALVQAVHLWNPRKQMFKPHQIEAARRQLALKGWLD